MPGQDRRGDASRGWARFGMTRNGQAGQGATGTGKGASAHRENVMSKKENVNNTSNDAADTIESGIPYLVDVELVGVSNFLFHRWSCDDVAAKSKAAKGSKAKKSDNVESYVYRNDDGELCVPGEYVRQAVIHAAKFRQDPRSPRKSAMDLYKAGVVAMTELCSLGVKDWDLLDRRRVVVQRAGVTRERPAMRVGWKFECTLQVLVPEYIDTASLNDVLVNAGRLVGIGDFRPTFGRFNVTRFSARSYDSLSSAAE